MGLPMAGSRAPAPAGGARAPRAVLAALGALALARLAFWLLAPPNSDEAYYWVWGRHPALSYFDHPPLLAWVQGAFHAALGRSLLVLRLPAALTTLATIALVARTVRRLAPAAAERAGGPALLAACALLGSPLLLMLGSFAWHDHLLVFLVALSGTLLAEFLAEVEAGERGRTGLLLGGAAALGLAALAKYSAVFLALGFAAAIALRPRLRHLLRQPRLWGAAALCLAVLAPVLLWNAEHGLASFRFHLVERHRGFRVRPWGIVHFLAPTAILLSPALVAAAWHGVRRPPAADAFARTWRTLALAVFAGSTAVFTGLALGGWSQYYWNVVAYVLLLPPAAAALASRPGLLRAHLATGVAVAAVMTVHGTVLPLTALVPGAKDDDSRELFGWGEVAAAVRAERAARPAELVAAADYRPAAHLAWALDDPGVTVLSARPSQFRYWLDPAAHAGASALVVTDHRARVDEVRDRFERLELVRTIPVVRLGVQLKAYELWRGEGYRPPPPGATAPR